MNIREAFEYTSRQMRVLRARKHLLYTFGDTKLPYISLSESPQSAGDIIVRRGEVIAERPRIAIPGREDLFCEGFDFGDLDAEMVPIFLMRRMGMPPARYINKSSATTTERGAIHEISERMVNALEQKNDIRTGVIASPDKVWHLAVLLYAGQQALRSAPANVAEQMERWLRQSED